MAGLAPQRVPKMVRNRVEDCDGADRAGVDAGVVTEQIGLLVHRRLDYPSICSMPPLSATRSGDSFRLAGGVVAVRIYRRHSGPVLIRYLYRRAEPGLNQRGAGEHLRGYAWRQVVLGTNRLCYFRHTESLYHVFIVSYSVA